MNGFQLSPMPPGEQSTALDVEIRPSLVIVHTRFQDDAKDSFGHIALSFPREQWERFICEHAKVLGFTVDLGIPEDKQ